MSLLVRSNFSASHYSGETVVTHPAPYNISKYHVARGIGTRKPLLSPWRRPQTRSTRSSAVDKASSNPYAQIRGAQAPIGDADSRKSNDNMLGRDTEDGDADNVATLAEGAPLKLNEVVTATPVGQGDSVPFEAVLSTSEEEFVELEAR